MHAKGVMVPGLMLALLYTLACPVKQQFFRL